MGHRGDINRCWYLVTSGRRTPRGRREKPNDWLGPQNGSEDSFPSAEVNNKKVSCLGRVRRRQNQKPSTPGEEDKRISETRGTRVLQASIKNSLKSISP